jgi:uncharacterized protein
MDPLFYEVAIPAVLLLGLSKSGFASGLGAMAVPLMAMVVSVPTAAAILMPVLLVLDILGLRAYRKDIDKKLLLWLVPCSLLGVFLGYLSFKSLETKTVSAMVGVSTLLFLAQRIFWPSLKWLNHPSQRTGALLSITSGFTSFMAHAGSPPINAYLLGLRLPPLRFASTLAVLFFWVNLVKWIPYTGLGLLHTANMLTALTLMPFAPMGVYLGVYLTQRMRPTVFYHLVHTAMFLTGCKLLWDGFS